MASSLIIFSICFTAAGDPIVYNKRNVGNDSRFAFLHGISLGLRGASGPFKLSDVQNKETLPMYITADCIIFSLFLHRVLLTLFIKFPAVVARSIKHSLHIEHNPVKV